VPGKTYTRQIAEGWYAKRIAWLPAADPPVTNVVANLHPFSLVAMTASPSNTNVYVVEATDYLKSLNISNVADTTRVIDVCTNPNSLFTGRSGRAGNLYARKLTIPEMQSVVAFLDDAGFGGDQIKQLIVAYPQLLCYSVDERLEPLYAYLTADVGLSNQQFVQVRYHISAIILPVFAYCACALAALMVWMLVKPYPSRVCRWWLSGPACWAWNGTISPVSWDICGRRMGHRSRR
jgi:mTERF